MDGIGGSITSPLLSFQAKKLVGSIIPQTVFQNQNNDIPLSYVLSQMQDSVFGMKTLLKDKCQNQFKGNDFISWSCHAFNINEDKSIQILRQMHFYDIISPTTKKEVSSIAEINYRIVDHSDTSVKSTRTLNTFIKWVSNDIRSPTVVAEDLLCRMMHIFHKFNGVDITSDKKKEIKDSDDYREFEEISTELTSGRT